ncbi:MAG TPA: response regulator [Reyranella sp.]|nr:response regulator [Reyranella sp.]
MRAGLSLVWAAPQGKESEPPAEDGARRPGNGHPSASTILVIEDEILIRLAVCDYLRHCGYRVIEGSSGEEAQRVLLAGEPVEVLFSDVDLGQGMSGLELAAWVRQHYPAVRILLTSGVAQLAEGAAHLCDGPFLRKPYAYSGLVDHIKRLLDLLGRTTG